MTNTFDVMNKFNSDYRLIMVGDAAMSPFEITYPGGSVEHHNEEAGSVWMERITEKFKHHIWINPNPESNWNYYESTRLLKEQVHDRMFPLTIEGIERGMRQLRKAHRVKT